MKTAKTRRFGRDFPSAWSEMERKDQGQFFTSKGLFTFKTINFLAGSGKSPQWKIVSYVDNKALDDSLGTNLNQFIRLLFGLIILAAVGSFALARTQLRRRSALEALAESEARKPFHIESAAQ